jgi:hypothetical protein
VDERGHPHDDLVFAIAAWQGARTRVRHHRGRGGTRAGPAVADARVVRAIAVRRGYPAFSPAIRSRCGKNASTPPHARTASAACRTDSTLPQARTTRWTRATLPRTAETSAVGAGAGIGRAFDTAAGLTGSGRALDEAAAFTETVSASGAPAAFLISLRRLWTKARTLSAGAVTPLALARLITSSADRPISPVRIDRTTALGVAVATQCSGDGRVTPLLYGSVVVPLEELPDEHTAGPWDDMSAAEVYESVPRTSRSYREKVEAYEAEPGSVDAHRAERHLARLLLERTGGNLRRAAHVLRHFSPFLIGESGRGRKTKLAGEYVVRTVLNAAIDRKLEAAAISNPAAGTEPSSPVPADESEVPSGGPALPAAGTPEGDGRGSPPGPGPDETDAAKKQRRRQPLPFVQNLRAREGFPDLSAEQREYCTFVDEAELEARLRDEEGRDPNSDQTRSLRDLIGSHTPVMPMILECLPGVKILFDARDCQGPVDRWVRVRDQQFDPAAQNVARHSRSTVILALDRGGPATAVVPHHFCKGAWCRRCGFPHRARVANHAALTFARWQKECGALYLIELDRGTRKLPDAARRAAKKYFVYTCNGVVVSTCDLSRFKGVKSSVRVSHEQALRRFVGEIMTIPISSDHIGRRRNLVVGGEQWEQDGVTEEERRASNVIRVPLSGGSLGVAIEAVRTSQGDAPLTVELEAGVHESEYRGPHRRFRATNPFVRSTDELQAWGDRIKARYDELAVCCRNEQQRAEAEEAKRTCAQIAAWILKQQRRRAERQNASGRMAC